MLHCVGLLMFVPVELQHSWSIFIIFYYVDSTSQILFPLGYCIFVYTQIFILPFHAYIYLPKKVYIDVIGFAWGHLFNYFALMTASLHIDIKQWSGVTLSYVLC